MFVCVKLNPFHWLKRWNDALLEPASVQGGTARQMFSRAIFNIDQNEMEEARKCLEKRKAKDTTNQKTPREAKQSHRVLSHFDQMWRQLSSVFSTRMPKCNQHKPQEQKTTTPPCQRLIGKGTCETHRMSFGNK